MARELVDQFGRPLRRNEVVRRKAPADLYNIDQIGGRQTAATGLTPVTLAHVLQASDRGNNLDLQTLAIEMPERDPGLFSDLQTRILSIAGAPLHVEAFDDSGKRGRTIAKTCQDVVVNQPSFRWLLSGLMDAVMHGYSVHQIVWDTTTQPWSFKEFEWCDPRLFQFDKETLKELRLRDDMDPDGVPLPPGMFLVHYPRIRTGLKLRGGLARLCAMAWYCKTSTLSDFLAFAEVYGMPIRVGKYDPGVTTEDEIETLRAALINAGHDACMIVPKSMDLEFVDARRPPSGDNVYGALIEYLDGQRTRAILGQAPASEGSSAGQGQAVAETRREVRADLRQWDAQQVSATVQYLLDQWVAFNYGLGAPRIKLRIDVDPVADVQAFTAAVLPWMREVGLEAPLSWVRRQLQMPEPKPGEEMLVPPMLPGAEPGGGGSARGLDGAKRGPPKSGGTPKV